MILGLLAALAASAPPAMQTQPAPAWEAAAVAPNAVDVPASAYRVKPGDTLTRVVARSRAGADAIARANKLAPPYLLRAGRMLTIPPGRYHLVAKGQSGIAIARAYGVDWSRIAALNHLTEPFILRAGDRLLLPSRSEIAGMSLEQRAAAFRIDIDDLVTGGEPAIAAKARPVTARPATPPAEPATAFAGRFAWPLTGRIIRPFGRLPDGARNDGINIAAKRGTPILAAADGAVAYAGALPGFGQLVLIRHGQGWLTAYGHADALLVTRGQSVTRGQPIARAGATGSALEPQLHFEIRQGRKPVDPLGLLPRVG